MFIANAFHCVNIDTVQPLSSGIFENPGIKSVGEKKLDFDISKLNLEILRNFEQRFLKKL